RAPSAGPAARSESETPWSRSRRGWPRRRGGTLDLLGELAGGALEVPVADHDEDDRDEIRDGGEGERQQLGDGQRLRRDQDLAGVLDDLRHGAQGEYRREALGGRERIDDGGGVE